MINFLSITVRPMGGAPKVWVSPFCGKDRFEGIAQELFWHELHMDVPYPSRYGLGVQRQWSLRERSDD